LSGKKIARPPRRRAFFLLKFICILSISRPNGEEENSMNRMGEKIGWSVGLLGSFLWVLILALLRIVQNHIFTGIAGFIIFAVLCILLFTSAPWRRPVTPYWKLLLPFYVLLAASVSLFVWDEGGLKAAGLDWWTLLTFTPVLLPLVFIGNKRWSDGQ